MADNGLVRSAAGVLVPADAVPRTREVWTREEFKLLNRIGKLLKSRGMTFSMHCESEECAGKPMSFEMRAGGSSALTCQCKERVFGLHL